MSSLIVHLEVAMQAFRLSQRLICYRGLLSQDVVHQQVEGALALVSRAQEHTVAFSAALSDPTACIRPLRLCSAAFKI